MDAGTEAKLAKLKTQLEDIEGRKIDASPEQLISLVFPIASHTYLALHQSDNDAWVTKRRIIFPLPICTDSRLLDSSGLLATGTDGKLVFRLRNFLCGRDGIAQFDEPVNVLATPQGQQPRHVTIAHRGAHRFDLESRWNSCAECSVLLALPSGRGYHHIVIWDWLLRTLTPALATAPAPWARDRARGS